MPPVVTPPRGEFLFLLWRRATQQLATAKFGGVALILYGEMRKTGRSEAKFSWQTSFGASFFLASQREYGLCTTPPRATPLAPQKITDPHQEYHATSNTSSTTKQGPI